MAGATHRKPNATADWPERFLAEYRKCGIITHAAKRAGVSRRAVELHKNADPEFAKAMADAREEATDLLEREALRRAVTGTIRAVYYKGAKCGLIREYSDTLLVLMLKANRSDKFRENVTQRNEEPTGLRAFERVEFEDV